MSVNVEVNEKPNRTIEDFQYRVEITVDASKRKPYYFDNLVDAETCKSYWLERLRT